MLIPDHYSVPGFLVFLTSSWIILNQAKILDFWISSQHLGLLQEIQDDTLVNQSKKSSLFFALIERASSYASANRKFRYSFILEKIYSFWNRNLWRFLCKWNIHDSCKKLKFAVNILVYFSIFLIWVSWWTQEDFTVTSASFLDGRIWRILFRVPKKCNWLNFIKEWKYVFMNLISLILVFCCFRFTLVSLFIDQVTLRFR